MTEELKKLLGEDTAFFLVAHKNEAEEAFVSLNGEDEVFVETLLNTVLSDNVDHKNISNHVWNILKQTVISILMYNSERAKDWCAALEIAQNQLLAMSNNKKAN